MDGDFKPFRVCSIYDTETTNFGTGADTRAFPVLFIVNDLREERIAEYVPGESDNIIFYRHPEEFIEYLRGLIEWGRAEWCVPIVCSYNVGFDLQPLMLELSRNWAMHVTAQTSTSLYTIDLLEDGEPVLRFWDTFFLEQNGLAAMGRTCGLAKASGDWDYDLVRTPETPLTEEEFYYAGRDVQVIPAYLRWILEANDFIKEDELGVRVITRSSLVRRMADAEIGRKRTIKSQAGNRCNLTRAFELTCAEELPQTYDSYATRKACFRGGFTFTAAATAARVVHNVASLDVVSMHHTFINGRRVPVDFRPKSPLQLQIWANDVIKTPPEMILKYYDMPFSYAFHARFRFTNIRLKAGSAFEHWGIGLIPQDKFGKLTDKEYSSENGAAAEDLIREHGYYARAKAAEFCLAKLMRAEVCEMHLHEIELWCVAQVYDFDSCRVLEGEGTARNILPPDYVTLQSNKLFAMKSELKGIVKRYRDGEAYAGPISELIPAGIAQGLREGSIAADFLQAYYQSSVKGMFNGIYGTQAMDLFRPDFCVQDGEISLDHMSGISPDTFADKLAAISKPRVLYNYGMRIVAGSRMHLVIAIGMIYDAFGDRVSITGGDTDSLKIACAEGITAAELVAALEPLHRATRAALDKTQARVRELWPDLASDLAHVGEFECENEGAFYEEHIEMWNKARVSFRCGHVSVTCAGLSRPRGAYTIEDFIEELIARGHSFAEVAPLALGYNVRVSNEICHSLERHRPKASDRFRGMVTDYLGNTALVDCPESIALYPADRLLGEPAKKDNAATLAYLARAGVPVEQRIREDAIIDGKAAIRVDTLTGEEIWT